MMAVFQFQKVQKGSGTRLESGNGDKKRSSRVSICEFLLLVIDSEVERKERSPLL